MVAYNRIDLTGQTFGMLTYVKEGEYKKVRRVICVCACGKEKEFLASNLLRGDSKSCGCLVVQSSIALLKRFHSSKTRPLKDLVGVHFGRYKVLSRAPTDRRLGGTAWNVKCETCSFETVTITARLKRLSLPYCRCRTHKMALADKISDRRKNT